VIVGPHGVKAELAITGPAVGLFPAVSFEIAQAQLEPGDILYCYTDGVTDARNAEREFFGKERLARLLGLPAPSAHELLARFATHLQAHSGAAEQFDDITMLALRRRTH
jgi:phosphoserine phosphatase RsbU/P